MEVGARELFGSKTAQQLPPARVQPLQQGQRSSEAAGAGVFQRDPSAFVIRLNGRSVFRQRQLEADIGVDVAVGQVMHNLPDGPVSVARVELLLGQAGNRLAQNGGCLFDDADRLL